MNCPKCGKENPNNVRVCSACGAELPVPAAAEGAAPAQQPAARPQQNLPDLTGRKIAGRYRIEKVIGRGGMGCVYLATDEIRSRSVALKFIHPTFIANATAYRRFVHEANLCLELSHPHIIRVHDIGEWEDQGTKHIFLSMEYLEGGTLRSWLSRVKRKETVVEWKQFVRVFRQILAGVAHAHDKGIIHRDLKPENVMLAKGANGRFRAVLMDFGLAKDMEGHRHTRADATLGTFNYMAPEQHGSASSADARADIYALGVIGYEMLTGRLPRGSVKKPSTLRGDLPPGIDAWIFRALEEEPADRYANVQEMDAALETISADRPAPAVQLASSGNALDFPQPQKTVEPSKPRQDTGLTLAPIDDNLIPGIAEISKREPFSPPNNLMGHLELPTGGINVADGDTPVLSEPTGVVQPYNYKLDGSNSSEDEEDALGVAISALQYDSNLQYDFSEANFEVDPWYKQAHYWKIAGAVVVGIVVLGAIIGFFASGGSQPPSTKQPPPSLPGSMIPLTSQTQAAASTVAPSVAAVLPPSGPVVVVQTPSPTPVPVVATPTPPPATPTGTPAGAAGMSPEMMAMMMRQQQTGGPSAVPPVSPQAFAWLVQMYQQTATTVPPPSEVTSWMESAQRTPAPLSDPMKTWIAASMKPIFAPVPPEIAAVVTLCDENATVTQNITSGTLKLAAVPKITWSPDIKTSFTLEFASSVTLTMRQIPGGQYQMGSPKNEEGREKGRAGDDEGPTHPVELDTFWMGECEITQAVYLATMGASPNHKLTGALYPVDCISWEDATAFCEKLSASSGMTFRLPTEAEWEYACRAGEFERFTSGRNEKQLGAYAWYRANSQRRMHQAGIKLPNNFGLFDMHGNVAEWCQDWYDPKTYDSSAKAVKNPTGPASSPASIGQLRVLRGGDWSSDAAGVRSAARGRRSPTEALSGVGFRIVCSKPVRPTVGAAAPVSTPPPAPAATPAPAVATPHADAAHPEWKTKLVDMGHGVQLEMMWVPAGKFTMGSPDTEVGRGKDEGPQHTVELDGFWMGRYEVTQAQYRGIMGNNPSTFQSAQDPVVQDTWANAADFCKRLSDQAKGEFALPTEAEWEYACRAGSQQAFSFGSEERELDKYAWLQDNSQLQPHPVGKKKPNTFGLYDMHGNVWEWCADWYASYPASKEPIKNPTGPSSGTDHVCRGGSCMTTSVSARSAFRFRQSEANSAIGFRVVAAELP
ncbi:TPA: hypothetical protein DDW35_01170 [Candidatus Sumerlaeota bacterium]|nr:hypothetical protein [Candidatus Sumerlaeota bacterium]